MITQTDEREQFINVIGHINPDTDSVCSAIAYAHLKNTIEKRKNIQYIPKRAGQINSETKFVIRYFGLNSPGYMGDVSIFCIGKKCPRGYNSAKDVSHLVRHGALKD